ncbi:hypothetical protein ACS0TY_014673 [Phlomoides rotata]
MHLKRPCKPLSRRLIRLISRIALDPYGTIMCSKISRGQTNHVFGGFYVGE